MKSTQSPLNSNELFDAATAKGRQDFVAAVAAQEYGQLRLRQLIDFVLEHLTDKEQLRYATDFCLSAEREADKQ